MNVALDTNLLAYAEGVNGADRKRAALDLIERLPPETTLLPVQALGELFAVLVKEGPPLAVGRARRRPLVGRRVSADRHEQRSARRGLRSRRRSPAAYLGRHHRRRRGERRVPAAAVRGSAKRLHLERRYRRRSIRGHAVSIARRADRVMHLERRVPVEGDYRRFAFASPVGGPPRKPVRRGCGVRDVSTVSSGKL